LDDLFAEGFSAVLIAVGAHEGIRLRIPGADLDGVLVNTHFLRDVRLGKYSTNGRPAAGDVPPLGKRVLVLGGGNVAIDCARSAVRLGVEVHLACLESREQMPAHSWEIEAAEAEGVVLHPGRSFEQILGDPAGRVRGVECLDVASFAFDENGRLEVEKTPGTNHVLPCDTVIFSVGQRAGLAFIPEDAGVGITGRQTIAINPNTMAATRPGVFAAGDSVSGTAFVIEAVNSGHQAAESIVRYLQTQPLEPPPRPQLPVVRLSRQEIEDRLASGEIKRQGRVPMPELPVELRVRDFSEVEGGYDDESAQAEAARCLACGICSECWSCVFACGRDAINHYDVERVQNLKVGAVILAPGYQTYNAHLSQEYGLGRYPNVVTSLQFERLLSASGPTQGHVRRPSDERTPQRIAFLQCVGSRDQSHDYCSAVCCMSATKEAVIAKEHHPGLDIHVFMMDMRAFSKGYWAYFERARQRYGVQFTRCRVSSLYEDAQTRDLILNYVEDGLPRQERFDMAVLSVGMEISEPVRDLGRRLGVELDEYGFCHTVKFNPLETSRPGIYAVGPFREPKDIPESVVEASGAAAAAASRLGSSRFSLTMPPQFPPERDVSGEAPRIGVFVCHCGSNIAGFLDVAEVTEHARGLPGVVHAESNLYTCSQDSIKHISEVIEERRLNRVVVASCTPLTHQPLFQDSLRSAGLNPYLFEMANIRNQCSWVHSDDRRAATEKARLLVGMAVARAALLEPQQALDVPVQRAALVVGGGAAGMTAALSLSGQGFPVHLVEKQPELGGNLRRVLIPSNGQDPQQTLRHLVERVQEDARITLHLESTVVDTHGFKGNFTSQIQAADGRRYEVSHGVTILATGGQEYRGPEYGYGVDRRVVAQQEFEALISPQPTANSQGLTANCQLPAAIESLRSIVMIQCVGPGEKFCSRICCSVALKNALAFKDRNPGASVTVLYKDIRSYGFKERSYTRARQSGVIFVRYDDEHRPEVVTGEDGELAYVQAWDPILRRSLRLEADLLVLSMPVVPTADARKLSALFKVPLDADGFFLEAHVKLRPVDFATDGLFMAGMAHYPKLLDETMIQAQAAAARAARVLSQETLAAGGRVAVVDALKCTGCLTCVRICPFNVPLIRPDLTGAGEIMGAAYIEPAVCQGCGSCAAECPARAIQLMHYTDAQMIAKVGALVQPDFGFVPQEQVVLLGT
jgi:heterodisulfide reductase subunit A-like polyferredoxin